MTKLVTKNEYTCEVCDTKVYLSDRQLAARNHVIRCSAHHAHLRNRTRHPDSRRVMGCIVTLEDEHRQLHVRHQTGYVKQALTEILADTPESWRVVSISTPRSVEADLKREGQQADVPFQVEQQLLGKIGQLHRLKRTNVVRDLRINAA